MIRKGAIKNVDAEGRALPTNVQYFKKEHYIRIKVDGEFKVWNYENGDELYANLYNVMESNLSPTDYFWWKCRYESPPACRVYVHCNTLMLYVDTHTGRKWFTTKWVSDKTRVPYLLAKLEKRRRVWCTRYRVDLDAFFRSLRAKINKGICSKDARYVVGKRGYGQVSVSTYEEAMTELDKLLIRVNRKQVPVTIAKTIKRGKLGNDLPVGFRLCNYTRRLNDGSVSKHTSIVSSVWFGGKEVFKSATVYGEKRTYKKAFKLAKAKRDKFLADNPKYFGPRPGRGVGCSVKTR